MSVGSSFPVDERRKIDLGACVHSYCPAPYFKGDLSDLLSKLGGSVYDRKCERIGSLNAV